MSAIAYMAVATSSRNDDWSTSPATFDKLNREFGPFDLDPAASVGNAKCPHFYTAAENGLLRPWTGRVWLNPPYGRTIGLWMAKARQEAAAGALVVCLVPARVDARWWRESVAVASLVRLLPGRLRFGAQLYPAPFPSAVLVFGPLAHRHGRQAKRCEGCREWFFPARADARTCSVKCRQTLSRRSQLARPKCDGERSGAAS